MLYTINKRKYERFPIQWVLYNNNHKDFKNIFLIGSTKDISIEGIGFCLDIVPTTSYFILNISPHPTDINKNLELHCSLLWAKNNYTYHCCGLKFIKMDDNHQNNIEMLIHKYKDVEKEIYLYPFFNSNFIL